MGLLSYFKRAVYNKRADTIFNANDGFYQRMLEGFHARHAKAYGHISMENYMERLGLIDIDDLDMLKHMLYTLHKWDGKPHALYQWTLPPRETAPLATARPLTLKLRPLGE